MLLYYQYFLFMITNLIFILSILRRTNWKILKVENLSYTYDDFCILNDISFSVFQGDFLGIIGPNGAGKTTLFNCILGYPW